MTEPPERASGDPGVAVRPLEAPAELRHCVEVQRQVWGPDYSDVVPPPMLKLATRLGGILAGAFDASGEMLGFVFGLTGVVETGIVHWSDMLAVTPAARDRGVGDALKRYQRDVLLRRGIDDVRWTFEPLESRNAHVNFTRLGVTSREYERDFYGGSDSPLHGEIGTDRLIVRWAIASERVARRLSADSRLPRPDEIETLPRINTHDTVAAHPRSSEPDLALDAPRILLAIPSDIQTLKREDPALAHVWREVTRVAFETYFARHYTAVDFVRSDTVGTYVLERRST